MLADFHNWQRKLGVLTLLVACVLATGWVRSLTVRDMILNSNVDFDGHQLISHHSSIQWKAYRPDAMTGGLKREVIASIPYWSIVGPVTFLSACLLLSSLRRDRAMINRTSNQL